MFATRSLFESVHELPTLKPLLICEIIYLFHFKRIISTFKVIYFSSRNSGSRQSANKDKKHKRETNSEVIDYLTPLHLAACNGHLKMCEFISLNLVEIFFLEELQ